MRVVPAEGARISIKRDPSQPAAPVIRTSDGSEKVITQAHSIDTLAAVMQIERTD
jgi:hypothetical protein